MTNWRSVLVMLVIGLVATCALAQGVEGVAENAKTAVVDSASAVADQVRNMKRDIEEVVPDALVAWSLIGLAVGGVVGSMVTMGRGRRVVHLLAGIAGGLIGGLISHLIQLAPNLGQVTLRYGDVLLAILVAAVLVVAAQVRRVQKIKAKAQEEAAKA